MKYESFKSTYTFRPVNSNHINTVEISEPEDTIINGINIIIVE